MHKRPEPAILTADIRDITVTDYKWNIEISGIKQTMIQTFVNILCNRKANLSICKNCNRHIIFFGNTRKLLLLLTVVWIINERPGQAKACDMCNFWYFSNKCMPLLILHHCYEICLTVNIFSHNLGNLLQFLYS